MGAKGNNKMEDLANARDTETHPRRGTPAGNHGTNGRSTTTTKAVAKDDNPPKEGATTSHGNDSLIRAVETGAKNEAGRRSPATHTQ